MNGRIKTRKPMNKDEYIARWGEEKWRAKIERNRERYHQKHPDAKNRNGSIEVKKYLPTPEVDSTSYNYYYEALARKKEQIALRLQRRLRREWAKISPLPHIIIAEAENSSKRTGMTLYRCELYVLTNDRETLDKFEELVNKIEI